MKVRHIILLLLLFFTTSAVNAQKFAVKSNLLSAVNGSLNAGVEYAVGTKYTVELTGSVRPWDRKEKYVNRYWYAQPEFRYWTCQKFNGHFFGAYMNGGEFNVGGKKLIFGMFPSLNEHRYEGWLIGAGMTYGYHWMLDRHWNIETSVRVGYEYVNYDKYKCPRLCAKHLKADHTHYVGPTSAAISIVYLF